MRVPLPAGPELPDWADTRDLDPAVRASLRGLDPRNADKVAGHLVVAGTLVDEDPETALAHARAARDRASRVAVVREAVGVAAYHAGEYAEAARELRAYRRMSGDLGYRAVLADCERALGRPEVALRLALESLAEGPDPEEAVELRLVEAGARRDLGEAAAARLVLEDLLGRRTRPEDLDGSDAGRLRIAVAYADLLRAEHQDDLADRWTAAVGRHAPELLEDTEDGLGVAFGEVEVPAVPAGGEDTPSAPGPDTRAEEPARSRTFEEEAEAVGPAGGPAEDPAVGPARSRTFEEEAEAVGPAEDPAGGPAEDPAVGPARSRTFEEEVEAEVAELLGEDAPEQTAEDDGRH